MANTRPVGEASGRHATRRPTPRLTLDDLHPVVIVLNEAAHRQAEWTVGPHLRQHRDRQHEGRRHVSTAHAARKPRGHSWAGRRRGGSFGLPSKLLVQGAVVASALAAQARPEPGEFASLAPPAGAPGALARCLHSRSMRSCTPGWHFRTCRSPPAHPPAAVAAWPPLGGPFRTDTSVGDALCSQERCAGCGWSQAGLAAAARATGRSAAPRDDPTSLYFVSEAGQQASPRSEGPQQTAEAGTTSTLLLSTAARL